MKGRKQYALRIMGSGVLLGVCIGAFAADCGQQSPRLAEQGEKYYEIAQSSGLSNGDRKALNRLVEKIQGDWSGQGRVLECGGYRNPLMEERDTESDLNIKLLKEGELHITEERLVKPEKTLNRDTAKLFSRWSNARIDEISETKLVVIEKYRRRTGPLVTGLWEIVCDFRVSDGELQYTTTRYVNGYLASRDTRNYRRNPYKRYR